MVSDKLNEVISAETEAAEKLRIAEKDADSIIEAAKIKAAGIIDDRKAEAGEKALRMLESAKAECERITEDYRQKADSEADRISKDASKNEMFGINTVIKTIIP